MKSKEADPIELWIFPYFVCGGVKPENMTEMRQVKNDDQALRFKQHPRKPRSIRSDCGLLTGSGPLKP